MTWLQQFFSRRKIEQDLREEIEQHIESKVNELVAGGMSEADAVLRARREFGNVALIAEQGGDVWRWGWVEDFLLDFRFGFRQLWRSAGFTTAAVLMLTVGVGVNTAVFSVIDAVLLRPLPFPEPERLIYVSPRTDRGPLGPYEMSYPNFFDFRTENTVFERLASYRRTDFSLTGLARPVQVRGAIVSWDLFSLLKVQPVLGQGFTAAEEDAGVRTVMVSHGLWKSVFGGDPHIVGQTMLLDRETYVIVGVAPPRFNFPMDGEQVHIWTTLAIDARSATSQPMTRQRGAGLLSLIGRLKPGVTREQAQMGMDGVAASLAERHPGPNQAVARTHLLPFRDQLVGATREPLWILFAAVGVVLLLASAPGNRSFRSWLRTVII